MHRKKESYLTEKIYMHRSALQLWLFAFLFVQLSARSQSTYSNEIKDAASSFIQTLDPLQKRSALLEFGDTHGLNGIIFPSAYVQERVSALAI